MEPLETVIFIKFSAILYKAVCSWMWEDRAFSNWSVTKQTYVVRKEFRVSRVTSSVIVTEMFSKSTDPIWKRSSRQPLILCRKASSEYFVLNVTPRRVATHHRDTKYTCQNTYTFVYIINSRLFCYKFCKWTAYFQAFKGNRRLIDYFVTCDTLHRMLMHSVGVFAILDNTAERLPFFKFEWSMGCLNFMGSVLYVHCWRCFIN
jgi:hypothetical protein